VVAVTKSRVVPPKRGVTSVTLSVLTALEINVTVPDVILRSQGVSSIFKR
jgi:hypothetical protein